MADSWQKYLYKNHAVFAVDPLNSECRFRLLDVLVKTSRRGSSPILYNIGSIFELGSKESQETADRLREGLKRFESNTECDEDDEELFRLDRAQPDIKHTVESRAAVKSSLRIFGDAANLDIDGDKHLECQLQRVQIASVDRAALQEIIGKQQWKPDVHKLTKLKYWSERSRFNPFGKSTQDLWVIYEILQAKKVILESVDSHSGAVGADITAVVPVGGPPVGANLRMSATKKTLFEYTAPDNKVRAFGFRAIHARYNSTGEFVSFAHVEEGSALPTRRAAAARRALDDPEWKRTYDEWRLQGKPVHSDARKGKNQNQETSGFTSPSYPRSEDWYSDDNDTFRSDDWLSVSVDWETEDEILRPAFGPDFPCTTDDHLKQENQFSTIGISGTTQNCFQNGLHEILTKGRKGKFEGADSIEFLFEQAEDMSKVVGVGLQWSKVVVTKQFGVVVEHIGEHSWFDLWAETSFSPMRIPIPKPPTELSKCNLTAEESSKRFGVGLLGSRLENNRVYVEDNQNQTGEMFPLIFKLAEKMGLSEHAKDSNFQHPSGISSEAVEGEKNDHGGPLRETMEGGGEIGGTSSEPMDPLDVGESSQGGNAGEPMEGVGSGQGGPSSGPTEVGGQRDQQSSDFQLRFESLQAKGPQDSNENKSLTVIVIPEAGGTFYEGLPPQEVQPDCRIKDAAIDPWLKFEFEIQGGARKLTTTTETVCDLGGGQLQLHEHWDLGYCHDNITISLICAHPQAVKVSPGTRVATDVVKRTTTETFTGSTSRANQVSGQASVQVQTLVLPIGVQAQGTLNVTDTTADSCALAVTNESSNTQFAGFHVNDNGRPGCLIFKFVYPEEIVDLIMVGRKKQFINAGISNTLRPTIVGSWIPKDEDEHCLYNFKTNRNIYSIGNLRRSHAEKKEPMLMEQRYEVPFYINHAMSHIHHSEDKTLEGPGRKSVDRVLIKFPEI